jgi:phosphonoacetate hydrolase
MDAQIGRLLDAGCVVAATADHGMNSKNKADGSPNVVYAETLLKEKFGDALTVICPITDPYVVHHGALGSLVMVHVEDQSLVPAMIDFLNGLDGVTEVYDRVGACRRLELAEDRIGDICVLCGRDFVLGKTAADHDLSVLKGGLRSHGGRYEEMVPMVLSHPLNGTYKEKALADPRNFDIFDFACNGLVL